MKIGLSAWLYALNPGGVEKIVHKIGEALLKLNQDPIFFYATSILSRKNKGRFGALGSRHCFTVELFVHPYMLGARYKSKFEQWYLRWAAQKVKGSGIAVFHGMGINALSGIWAGRPTVSTVVALSQREWNNFYYKETIEKSHHIVALAQKTKDQLIAHGVESSKVTCLYQGVDAERFGDMFSQEDRHRFLENYHLPHDKRFLAAIHNFHPKKRTSDVLEAFAELSQHTDMYRLLLAGLGDGAIVRRRIRELKLENKVFILDIFGSEKEVSKIYNVSDLFILPGETFPEDAQIPLVLFEALCAGIPIVAANVGAVSEIMNTRVGILVSPADSSALFRALAEILLVQGKKYDTQIIREHGRQYDWGQTTRRLLDIYKKVCAEF